MECNDIINNLINDMKEELSFFSNKEIYDKYLITIKDNLIKEDYIEFLRDISTKDYDVQSRIDDNCENIIGIDVYVDEDVDYFYRIRFTDYEELIGYCACVPDDEGYDARYDCCGEDCDWLRPGFNLSKVVVIGSEQYEGDEKSLWNKLDEFRKVSDEEKEKIIIQKEIDEIDAQIKELQEQLLKLKEGM